MGAEGRNSSYRITGPDGPTDYGNSQSGVSGSDIYTLEEAQKDGYKPAAKEDETKTVEKDPATVETAKLVKAVVDETNRARTDPGGFAAALEKILAGAEKKSTGGGTHWNVTIAGESTSGYSERSGAWGQFKADAESAIQELKAMSPLPALTFDDQLSRASHDLAADKGPLPQPHVGSDHSTAFDRMQRYGSYGAGAAENLGGALTGFGTVAGFIIDWMNGPSYGHRKNILGGYTHLGVSCVYHAPADPNTHYGFIRCVQNFAKDWKPKATADTVLALGADGKYDRTNDWVGGSQRYLVQPAALCYYTIEAFKAYVNWSQDLRSMLLTVNDAPGGPELWRGAPAHQDTQRFTWVPSAGRKNGPFEIVISDLRGGTFSKAQRAGFQLKVEEHAAKKLNPGKVDGRVESGERVAYAFQGTVGKKYKVECVSQPYTILTVDKASKSFQQVEERLSLSFVQEEKTHWIAVEASSPDWSEYSLTVSEVTA